MKCADIKLIRLRAILSPDEIQRMRERIGMSQARMAGALGVSKHAIEQWEAPEDSPCSRRISDWAAMKLIDMHREVVM